MPAQMDPFFGEWPAVGQGLPPDEPTPEMRRVDTPAQERPAAPAVAAPAVSQAKPGPELYLG